MVFPSKLIHSNHLICAIRYSPKREGATSPFGRIPNSLMVRGYKPRRKEYVFDLRVGNFFLYEKRSEDQPTDYLLIHVYYQSWYSQSLVEQW